MDNFLKYKINALIEKSENTISENDLIRFTIEISRFINMYSFSQEEVLNTFDQLLPLYKINPNKIIKSLEFCLEWANLYNFIPSMMTRFYVEAILSAKKERELFVESHYKH